MPDGVAQPTWTPLEQPAFVTAQKQPVNVLGWRSSTTAAAGSMAPGLPNGGNNARDNMLADNIGAATARKLGPFKDRSVYRFVLLDNAALSTGTPNNVCVRFGTDAEVTANPAVATDMPIPTALNYGTFEYQFKEGQTHMSIIALTGGAKTMSLYASRLL